MNHLGLCLEVISRSCQPLRYIRSWISQKPLKRLGSKGPRIGNDIWRIKWSRDWWRNVTQKVLWGKVGYPSDSLTSCFLYQICCQKYSSCAVLLVNLFYSDNSIKLFVPFICQFSYSGQHCFRPAIAQHSNCISGFYCHVSRRKNKFVCRRTLSADICRPTDRRYRPADVLLAVCIVGLEGEIGQPDWVTHSDGRKGRGVGDAPPAQLSSRLNALNCQSSRSVGR